MFSEGMERERQHENGQKTIEIFLLVTLTTSISDH